MPPQTDQNPDNSEQADFGFMLNQQQPAPTAAGPAGKLSGLGKPAKILAALGVIFIVVIAAALILGGGGGGNSQQVLDLMAQNQEIVRVSMAQDQKLTDGDTKGLSVTTQASLNTQKLEFADYLAKAKFKYEQKQLASKTNTATDFQLEAAAQNNNLEDAYAQYLKNSLQAYSNSLSAAYKSTDSQSLKAALQSAFDSVQILLDSPQFRG